MSKHINNQRITISSLKKKKVNNEKIVCLTAYDASFTQLVDDADVDVVLVGDSLGMVIQGHETTLPVTIDDMLYHSQSVSRGITNAMLMVDMPFLSYTSKDEAVANAGLLMKHASAHIVKLEGGADQAETVSTLTHQGIPVCAHLGLQPQHVHKLGGYKVQGREADTAKQMLHEAKILEQAGADLMLLECVPSQLAAKITKALSIPVIGIGAGSEVDGQILVLYDILGISSTPVPKFTHNFLADTGRIDTAILAYAKAVRNGTFPAKEHTFQ